MRAEALLHNISICALLCAMHNLHREDLVTLGEVAEQLGRGRKAVRGLMKRGELTPVMKFPGQTGAYLFRRDDVDELVDRLRTRAAS